jgi:hypothetical protein
MASATLCNNYKAIEHLECAFITDTKLKLTPPQFQECFVMESSTSFFWFMVLKLNKIGNMIVMFSSYYFVRKRQQYNRMKEYQKMRS